MRTQNQTANRNQARRAEGQTWIGDSHPCQISDGLADTSSKKLNLLLRPHEADFHLLPAYNPVMRLDWSNCPLVEVVPGKVSGVPILKGTRMPADSIVENYESGSPVAEISENFDIPDATIRELLAFATRQQSNHRP
jgi:uncharacterized protein (DUF433 family)